MSGARIAVFGLVAVGLFSVVGCAEEQAIGRITLDVRAPDAQQAVVGAVAPAPEDLPPDGVLQLAYAPVATELNQESWQPLTDHLVRRLGLLIEPVPYDSYAGVVEAMIRGEAELALLAPLSYVLVKEAAPGVEPLVQSLNEGKTTYFFVERGSSYHSVADLRGARVAFVDERSTSGFLLPYAQLLDQGIEPEEDLAQMIFTGSHVGALRAVAEDRADAAASYADVLTWASREALQQDWDLPAFRLLGNAGRIPLDVLCVSPELGESVRTTLHDELLRANTSTPAGRAFFVSSGRIVGWAETDDTLYDGVREVQREVRARRGGGP